MFLLVLPTCLYLVIFVLSCCFLISASTVSVHRRGHFYFLLRPYSTHIFLPPCLLTACICIKDLFIQSMLSAALCIDSLCLRKCPHHSERYVLRSLKHYTYARILQFGVPQSFPLNRSYSRIIPETTFRSGFDSPFFLNQAYYIRFDARNSFNISAKILSLQKSSPHGAP